MLNVHASLLPRWRGAAPIVHAIANGDTKTGVTVMKIKPHKFDVGQIVKQAEVDITEDMEMPELYRQLAQCGSEVLLDVIKSLPDVLDHAREQNNEEATSGMFIVVLNNRYLKKSRFNSFTYNNITSVSHFIIIL